jgi:electron transport complex protein RnfB
MERSVYERLADALDRLPNGFPRTHSGVELVMLQRIFSEDDALVASVLDRHLTDYAVIAKKMHRPAEQVQSQLRALARRGLVGSNDRRTAFRLRPWLVGIYEAFREEMDHQFAHLVEEYFAQGGAAGIMQPDPALHRVIPTQSAVKSEWILPYDDVKALLDANRVFNVHPCICRKQQDFIGRRCDFPLEICISFSAYDRPPRSGDISKAEAVTLLDRAEELGLVHTVSNVIEGVHYVCNCCSCCCTILRGIRDWGVEHSVAQSNYYTTIDSDACTGCGVCQTRCQMSAITIQDGVAAINRQHCIGCGLCVTSCPSNAAQLHLKPEDQIVHPPHDFAAWEQERLHHRHMND